MKLFFSLAVLFFTASSFSQGTIIFNNRTPSGDAPISRWDGTGAGAGYTAQLYLVGAGGALTPLTPTTTFRNTSAAAAFFINDINPFRVEGVLPGQSATFRFVVWETSAGSYENAVATGAAYGRSPTDVTVAQLGGIPAGGAPIPPPALNGLIGFTVPIIPEPSSIALGLLGATVLLGFRRR